MNGHDIDTAAQAIVPLSSNGDVESHAQSLPVEATSSKNNGVGLEVNGTNGERPAKRARQDETSTEVDARDSHQDRRHGEAPIKAEYRIDHSTLSGRDAPGDDNALSRDDLAEGQGPRTKKQKGANKARDFGSSRDAIRLCMSRAIVNEFAPLACKFGDTCKYEHDIRKYLTQGKRDDIDTFNGKCPILEERGFCSGGWKCRFVKFHSTERTLPDGRQELVLTYERPRQEEAPADDDDETAADGTVNIVPQNFKFDLSRRKVPTPKSEPFIKWLDKMGQESTAGIAGADGQDDAGEKRAAYHEPPFLPSEKRRIYYGPETPVLAPLTTTGNMPFRRLCVELGAQITWSEMAMCLPLLQGHKSEWALMKAHESELNAPKYTPKSVIADYDNSKDLRFGVQLAGNKPWSALKTTEILTAACPSLRAIDLNCGCPIDLVYRQGAGSALLDTPGKLEKILRGMNAVSNEVPITLKIRMGTKDGKPTANKLVDRIAFGGSEAQDYGLGPCGVAAITLHGRSRQQRYTRSADWSYIAECAATIKRYNDEADARADTVREPDARDLPAGHKSRLFFIGNGDCYSHEDYYNHIKLAGVDSVMLARGALIKPWIFEEIESAQYLDKSASERLQYIEKFARYGLATWGSDEVGLGTTRRFLLEWLSFSCRYVPIGLLEHLPPRIQDRPPAYKGRNELETLLASGNYKDWIKISEMFLGKAHDNFRFEPKHKSNAYESVIAEG